MWLFVVLGIEIITFLLLFVYVGAIILLLLFVLMILMLELQGEKLKLVVFVFSLCSLKLAKSLSLIGGKMRGVLFYWSGAFIYSMERGLLHGV